MEQPVERLIFINGELIPASKASISVFDHGFLYGDGIFEGIRVYSGRVFKLDEHLDRLYDSAKALLLQIPYTKTEMSDAVLHTVRANDLHDAYIRLVISRGPGDLGLDPTKCAHPTVIIIADTIRLYPEEVYQRGMDLAAVAIRRPGTDVLNPAIKSLNYLNSVLAKIEANLRGLSEVLILNQAGHVVEGTGDNVFLVKGGALITPPTYSGILNGITRQVVLDLAHTRGIVTYEHPITLHDVYTADECFLTGTAAEVIGVVSCDGRQIGSGEVGKVTKLLREAFFSYARTQGVPAYAKGTLTL